MYFSTKNYLKNNRNHTAKQNFFWYIVFMDYEEPKFTYKEHQLQDASEQVEITLFYSHFPTSNQCKK